MGSFGGSIWYVLDGGSILVDLLVDPFWWILFGGSFLVDPFW